MTAGLPITASPEIPKEEAGDTYLLCILNGKMYKTTLDHLMDIGEISGTGTNDYDRLINQPFKNLDLSSDTKTLEGIGEGSYIVTKTGTITTAGGYSRVIGKGTEIIIVLTSKSGINTLCATFQDGANFYRIDDDTTPEDEIRKILDRNDIVTDISTAANNKKVAGALAVKDYIDNIIGAQLAVITGGEA